MSSDKNELNEKEKLLYRLIQENSIEEVKVLLNDPKVRIDCLEEQGMTPLQHAAFRGNYEICQLLLDRGANINSNHHEYGYSTLMFASLTGKLDVVSLLLENGASTTAVNSVGRTAAQMAAFVGNHDVVSIINNFIPKEEIDYYTKPQGFETEPKLPPHLAGPLYKLVVRTNIHPVRLALYLQENVVLLEEGKKVVRVLESLSEKEVKKSDANELLVLKFHHLAFVVKHCEQFYREKKKEKDALAPLMKSWIKGRESDGFPVVLEKFLRQCVQEFPYRELSLLQQLVRTLAPVKIGDEPSAISILFQVVRGQKGCDDVQTCASCGEPKPQKRCSVCKSVLYCDRICQKFHWTTHKMFCNKLAEKYKEEQDVSDAQKQTEKSMEVKSDGQKEIAEGNKESIQTQL